MAVSRSNTAATSKATSDETRLVIETVRSGGTSDSDSSLYSLLVDSRSSRISSTLISTSPITHQGQNFQVNSASRWNCLSRFIQAVTYPQI
jgi:hypothetical protein